MPIRTVFFAWLILQAIGCTVSNGDPPVVTVRDSAGIRIVESHAPSVPPERRWTVQSPASMLLGSLDGPEETQFFRITSVASNSTREIVVANAGTKELRWFDRDGRFLFSAGGEGEGPGEFAWLDKMLIVAGDSVLAEDGFRNLVNLYSPDGKFVRSWSIGPLSHFNTPPPLAQLADGSFLARTNASLTDPPGHVQYRVSLVRYDEGVPRDTLLQFPGGEGYFEACGPNDSAICNVGVPYGAAALVAAKGNRIAFFDGRSPELSVIDLQGRSTVLRTFRAPIPLTPQMVEGYIDSVLAPIPPDRRPASRRRIEGAPVPEHLPFYVALHFDAEQNLWAARGSADPEENAWEVFDPDGMWLTTVDLPAGLTVHEVGADFILCLRTDELGVESVEVYDLIK